LSNFHTANGKFDPSTDITIQLISEIFELPVCNNPFAIVRTKISEETEQQLANPFPEKSHAKLLGWVRIPFVSSRKSPDQKKKEIEELGRKKLETIEWIERDWNALLGLNMVAKPVNSADFQLPKIEPSAPPLDDFPDEEIPTAAIINPVPVETTEPPKKLKPEDPNVPLISYVDITFKELLSQGNDHDKWHGLPPDVRKDVLRHVNYLPALWGGKAETLACRIFKNDGVVIDREVRRLAKERYPRSSTAALKEEFISTGEAFLDFYYSDKMIVQYKNFIDRFQALPKEPQFFSYVYEMAQAANVHIEPWDHEFAEHNWDKPGILHLSVQALERYLHTTSK
jgi:hypothetical protein